MAREFAKSFYNSKAWAECRKGFMQSKHYVCERCGRAAELVHHKKRITPDNVGDSTVTLNWSNLEALCSDCHNSEHGKEHRGEQAESKATADGISFDSEGNVVYTPRID